LQKALAAAGIAATADRDGGLRTDAGSEEVGRAAAAEGVALLELRPAQGAGLEQMFLDLTGDTQRETRSAEGAPA
jgi:ABC-2 type transport system ATP-binding protein